MINGIVRCWPRLQSSGRLEVDLAGSSGRCFRREQPISFNNYFCYQINSKKYFKRLQIQLQTSKNKMVQVHLDRKILHQRHAHSRVQNQCKFAFKRLLFLTSFQSNKNSCFLQPDCGSSSRWKEKKRKSIIVILPMSRFNWLIRLQRSAGVSLSFDLKPGFCHNQHAKWLNRLIAIWSFRPAHSEPETKRLRNLAGVALWARLVACMHLKESQRDRLESAFLFAANVERVFATKCFQVQSAFVSGVVALRNWSTKFQWINWKWEQLACVLGARVLS